MTKEPREEHADLSMETCANDYIETDIVRDSELREK